MMKRVKPRRQHGTYELGVFEISTIHSFTLLRGVNLFRKRVGTVEKNDELDPGVNNGDPGTPSTGQ